MDEGQCAPRPLDFREWVGTRREALRTTAYLVCADWHLADDLVQDALVRVYARWSRVSAGGPPDAYTRQVLVRLYLDRTRRAWFKREASTPNVPDHQLTWDPIRGDDDTATLQAALEGLPARQRTVLVLRYWDDLTLEQVAATLGCSVGTAKSHASRGLATLRSRLSQQQTATGPELLLRREMN
jgi:RNA polymerase sigma-70 factor (sigma-E family)